MNINTCCKPKKDNPNTIECHGDEFLKLCDAQHRGEIRIPVVEVKGPNKYVVNIIHCNKNTPEFVTP